MTLTVLVKAELRQSFDVKLLPSDRITLEPIEEGMEGEEVKNVSVLVTVWILKWLEGEGTVVKGKATELRFPFSILILSSLLPPVQS